MTGDALDWLLTGTRIVDLAIAVLVVEIMLMVLANGRAALTAFGPNVLSGLALLMALRCAMADAGIAWVAAWLAAGGIAHIIDQWARVDTGSASLRRRRHSG